MQRVVETNNVNSIKRRLDRDEREEKATYTDRQGKMGRSTWSIKVGMYPSGQMACLCAMIPM